MKKTLKIIGIVLLSLIALFIVSIGTAKTVTWFQTKINKDKGIMENRYIDIGGQKQFISIRGQNRKNPVVIFLHGGPGSPMAYAAYYWQQQLEKDLTFVNWDQRGCGRTYFANKKLHHNLSQELLLEDLDELVDYCRTTFNKDKVIIMAHSNGTTFGLEYVSEHPEKVSEYIGIGQLVNAKEGDLYCAEKYMETLEGSNPKKKELYEALRLYREYDAQTFDFNTFLKIRSIVVPYYKGKKEASAFTQLWTGIRSPYMSFRDIRWFCGYMTKSEKIYYAELPLMNYTFFDFDAREVCGTDFEVPVAFLGGEHDSSTPLKLVQDYFQEVQAPEKQLITFEDYGHMLFLDSPKDFTESVKEILNLE